MISKSQQKRLDVQTGITENFTKSWCVDRRIACEGYPGNEALYLSVKEYISDLELELDKFNKQ